MHLLVLEVGGGYRICPCAKYLKREELLPSNKQIAFSLLAFKYIHQLMV